MFYILLVPGSDIATLFLCPYFHLSPSNEQTKSLVFAVFLPELKAKRGGRIEKTTTSKGLMHSNDHIKENWAMIEGGAPPTPLGESLVFVYFY